MVLAERNYVHSAYVLAAYILEQNWNDHDRNKLLYTNGQFTMYMCVT